MSVRFESLFEFFCQEDVWLNSVQMYTAKAVAGTLDGRNSEPSGEFWEYVLNTRPFSP